MHIEQVTENNKHIYHNLVQAYEAEFSAITGKKPDQNGLFALDTHLGGAVIGYLFFINGFSLGTLNFSMDVEKSPIGFAAIKRKDRGHYEVCEFYVVPSVRLNNLGARFAHKLWRKYPGLWEVKQISGAEHATQFWRKAISAYSEKGYNEESYQDRYWGVVTRQLFHTG